MSSTHSSIPTPPDIHRDKNAISFRHSFQFPYAYGIQSYILNSLPIICINKKWTARWAFQVARVVKNTPANAGDKRDMGLIPGLGRSPEGEQSTPVFLPGESHGQRSLAGYRP